ncbi:ABC-three component system protein [Streptomyces radiopugnans]|uniref:ABC-three component systems C-terminal domain-containing protein n=1 Tax=Streptomyces radiopugnans TaxID=403935 RepID=A0A1H9KFF5_9ACTN|nr:ABC-three component system protein [Streptomyces radiopugnans]SEQ97808.1 hypothetical protein SAMN05216481_12325 [Streptomyces radiopugnans]
MADRADPFEASASAIGYVYQVRKALHSCVERYARGLEWSIAIEAGDDVEETVRDGRVYYQLKHRALGTRLTDSSTDLWKTLRIWCHAVTHQLVDLEETDLLLLTTADLPEGSIGSLLQPASCGTRDEERALQALNAARAASGSQALRKAFEAFDALTEDQRRRMLARIQVIGNAPDVDGLEDLLLQRVVLAVDRSYARPFLQRLEGWIYQRTIRQLRSNEMDAITGSEFDQVFTDLRNQFRPENLPIDEDVTGLAPDPSAYADQTFVRQLDLIDLGGARVRIAVRDYLRAFTQRSRWVKENLLQLGELDRYERRLVEEWEELFAEMEDDLGEEATEAEKVAAARGIYRWAMREARHRIRPECDEPFVTKGSFHMLADEQQIGWHIDFAARLMTLLELAGARPS